MEFISGGNLICNCRPSFTSTNNCWHNYSYYYYYFWYILYLSGWVINLVFLLIVHGSSYQPIASNQIEIKTKKRKKDPRCFASMDVEGQRLWFGAWSFEARNSFHGLNWTHATWIAHLHVLSVIFLVNTLVCNQRSWFVLWEICVLDFIKSLVNGD